MSALLHEPAIPLRTGTCPKLFFPVNPHGITGIAGFDTRIIRGDFPFFAGDSPRGSGEKTQDFGSMASTGKTKGSLTITRIFDAPRRRVWDAWTDPQEVIRWWGPEGFTAPAVTIDFRVGGKYLSCMRDPDGRDYWSTGTYREIEPMERIVATDSFADEHGNVVSASHYGMPGNWQEVLLVTVTFEDVNGRTKLRLYHEGFPSGDMAELAKAGWNQSLDKFAQVLEEGKSS